MAFFLVKIKLRDIFHDFDPIVYLQRCCTSPAQTSQFLLVTRLAEEKLVSGLFDRTGCLCFQPEERHLLTIPGRT